MIKRSQLEPQKRAKKPVIKSFQEFLTVFQWNVLAPPYTQFMKGPPYSHGHYNLKGEMETPFQTSERYKKAYSQIMKKGADVLLLSEVEPDFFNTKTYPDSNNITRRYHIFPSNNRFIGTRVLINKSSQLGPMPKPIRCEKYIPGSKKTGGISNDATIVRAKFQNFNSQQTITFVSVHLGRSNKQARYLLKKIERELSSATHVVIGGVFNTNRNGVSSLQNDPFLGGFQRLPMRNISGTALNDNGTGESMIDHLLVTPSFQPIRKPEYERNLPCSPYASQPRNSGQLAKVQAASDHIWINHSLRLTFETVTQTELEVRN